MTTSFTRTREQLSQMVMRKLGILGNTSVVSADADIVYEAIDLRLKEMHRLGIFWRKVTSVPVTFSLSASIVSASAGAGDILFPIKMTFTNGADDDPIRIVGASEYAAIQDKTRAGNPERALWKGGTEFMFYPVPMSNGTAKLLYEKIADDTSAGSAPDVEVSMMRWLKDLVAYDVADDFGVPEQKLQRFMKEADKAEKNIRKLAVQHTDYRTVTVNDWGEDFYASETEYGD